VGIDPTYFTILPSPPRKPLHSTRLSPYFRPYFSRISSVQQKLMRHSDIRTTMNIYGDVVTDEMGQAHSKVVGLALSRKALN